MTNIGRSGRDGVGDHPTERDDARGFGPRNGSAAARDDRAGRNLARPSARPAELVSRVETFRARLDSAKATHTETDPPPADARILATAQWFGGDTGRPAPEATAAPARPAEPPARTEAIVADTMRRIEAALAADIGWTAGTPIGLRLHLGDGAVGLRQIEISVAASDLQVTFVRDPAEAGLDFSAMAAELADRLSRRFQGRRVTVGEAAATDGRPEAAIDGGSLGLLAGLFRDTSRSS